MGQKWPADALAQNASAGTPEDLRLILFYRLDVSTTAAFASLALSAPRPISDTSSQERLHTASQNQGVSHVKFDPTKCQGLTLIMTIVNDNAGDQPNWLTSYRDNPNDSGCTYVLT